MILVYEIVVLLLNHYLSQAFQKSHFNCVNQKVYIVLNSDKMSAKIETDSSSWSTDEEPKEPSKNELKRKIIQLKKSLIEKDNELEKLKTRLKEKSDETKQLEEEPYRKNGKGKDLRYFCNTCDIGLCTVSQMIMHLQTCNPNSLKFTCTECNRKFMADRDLKRHSTMIHKKQSFSKNLNSCGQQSVHQIKIKSFY